MEALFLDRGRPIAQLMRDSLGRGANMAITRSSLTRLGICLAIAAAVELVLGTTLEFVGVPYSGYELGGLLWDFHIPGKFVLCNALRLCGGYDHFVISDAWVIGQPQYPDPSGLVILGFANAAIIGILAFLVWTALVARSRRSTSTGGAAA